MNKIEKFYKEAGGIEYDKFDKKAGINASAKAARDYYQSLVQDGGLSIVSICGDCEGKGYIFYKNGAAWIKANCTTCNS